MCNESLYLVDDILADDERNSTRTIGALCIFQVTSNVQTYLVKSLRILQLDGANLLGVTFSGIDTPTEAISRHCRHTHKQCHTNNVSCLHNAFIS